MTIINTIKTKMDDSLLLTIIYTIGHFIIAVACVYIITGATLELATVDALVEPILNAIWLYVLQKIYYKYKIKDKQLNNSN
tara:strand:- start:1049 stop:1291 length:243 start_codon:yes stop_codon:yes gene_type:complete